jgi:hypothetical protein
MGNIEQGWNENTAARRRQTTRSNVKHETGNPKKQPVAAYKREKRDARKYRIRYHESGCSMPYAFKNEGLAFAASCSKKQA